jgi:3-keto-5-aminohexanoate cleavage enzyme
MSISDKVVINAALTGAVLTKADTPHLPVSFEEVATAAREARDAGAAIVHLHARKPDGTNSTDPADFIEMVRAVRAACPDLIVCCSLSGRYVPDVDARAAGLAARPELASLTVGSMNFANGPSINAPATIRELARRIQEAEAVPELEIFEPGFAHMASVMAERGELKPPFYANIILGALGASPLDFLGLGNILRLLPAGTTWSLGGLGRYQLDATLMALAGGGHLRVGIEDNIHLDRARTILATNGQLVERAANLAVQVGRTPATPAEARAILGLREGAACVY